MKRELKVVRRFCDNGEMFDKIIPIDTDEILSVTRVTSITAHDGRKFERVVYNGKDLEVNFSFVIFAPPSNVQLVVPIPPERMRDYILEGWKENQNIFSKTP